ncbi:hypothetical protein [Cupriavidus pampae]|uniref:Uncharacterized protein n=1 Tax=Cupriavidus pampae TaxID=659251 RepID=A0ABM8XC72_9BURK|nr:hypothetical protein [Cupriavidus pampae]CAG9177659.1 hypothetical protein LMG32289_03868 [Cupriavidus pampae]
MMAQSTVHLGPAAAAPNAANQAKPRFMRVGATQLRTIVQRGSPMFKEGAWPSPEACLLAAVVEQWLFDVVQEARRQMADDAHLYVSAQVRTLYGFERVSVQAVASAIGIEPVWLDRILDALELSFIPIAQETRQ